MTKGNENFRLHCRFLMESDFEHLHETFLEAFSDYLIPFQISVEQLRNHIRQNLVDFDQSVGMFTDRRMIGFSLNGFGDWNGLRTVYDAGTGVIPEFRGQRVGRRIFEFILPHFGARGFEQMLLEVIADNSRAVRLYESLGFSVSRDLGYLECPNGVHAPIPPGITIAAEDDPNWSLFASFGDVSTSWQNSVRSMKRSSKKRIVTARKGDVCVGYAIFFPKSGIITQIAVAREHRGNGIGRALLSAIGERIEKTQSLRASNVERSSQPAEFLKTCGFQEAFFQHEMTKML